MLRIKLLLSFSVIVFVIITSNALPPVNTSSQLRLLKLVKGIELADEQIRGLKFKEKPEFVVLTEKEAKKMFPTSGGETSKMEVLILKLSLLVPANYNLTRVEKQQSLGWIALTSGNTVYIIADNFFKNPAVAKRTIAHELVHVLQKQWFNAPYSGSTTDSTLAIQALVEGDADLVADIYCREHGIPIYKITYLYTRDPLTDMSIFPYVFGDPFVTYLYEKGGWELVNAAYWHLPISTKQVMFPHLYLENWTPLNLSPLLPRDYDEVYRDRMGAFYVFLHVWGFNGTYNEARELARHWVGDGLVLGRSNSSYILIWKVEFDSRKWAETFAVWLRKDASFSKGYASYTISIEGNTVELKAVKK